MLVFARLFVFASGAARADALSTPLLSGPLVSNPDPMSFDAGPAGKIYVTGIVNGLALYQTNHTRTPYDHESLLDFSNAEVFVQKADGLVQFFVQAGEYSIPALGLPYVRAATTVDETYGPVPVAYLKIAPTDSFNLEAGKLPTLVGPESTFTFENLNIERGLLWNQTPGVNRGVQVNYTSGSIALSFSWNDGIYSNKYNWLSGSAAYAISTADSLTFLGGGDLGKVDHSFSPQANSSIYNLVWTHTSGPWMIMPYAQYTLVPRASPIAQTSTWGGAIFTNYAFNSNWSLGGRVEYIAQNGGGEPALYGPGSTAWSLTVTPTFQWKIFFARADLSYVSASGLALPSSQVVPGPGFGASGTETGQFRTLVEAGVLF